MKKINSGFTLIEVVVGVTIFSVILITMMSIYILSSDTSLKSDINRAMHENIKSIVTEISEDVMLNNVTGISSNPIEECSFSSGPGNFKKGTKLCVSSNEYYLSKKVGENYIRTQNSECENFTEQCYIVKNGVPLSNSLVSIKSLDFYVTNTFSKKVTMNIKLQPTTKAGVKLNLISENVLLYQTTISERPF